jgi:tetratricopeptide (TPR) repeat protein
MMVLSKIFFFILLLLPASWTYISQKNTAIHTAATSYAQADYEGSITNHLLLESEYGVTSPKSKYNLALSYHYGGKMEDAQRIYLSLLTTGDKGLASFASNQNGIILGSQKEFDQALQAFKLALINDPNNESARYNYELLSRWLKENPDQQDNQGDTDEDQKDEQEPEDQENQDQKKENQEPKDGEGDEQTEEDEASESQKKEDKSGEQSQNEEESEEPSDIESDLSEREKAMEKMREQLQEMNLSPEQAAQILDAMNGAELRYIQQNKKKPTQRPDRGLPDW